MYQDQADQEVSETASVDQSVMSENSPRYSEKINEKSNYNSFHTGMANLTQASHPDERPEIIAKSILGKEKVTSTNIDGNKLPFIE